MRAIKLEDLNQEMINELIDREERFYVITTGDEESSLLSEPDANREAYEFWSNRDKSPRPLYTTSGREMDSRGRYSVSLDELMGRINPTKQGDEVADVPTSEWELYRREAAATHD